MTCAPVSITLLPYDKKTLRLDLPHYVPEIEEYHKHGHDKVWLFKGFEPGYRLSAQTIALIFEHACSKAGVHRRGGIHGFRQVQELLGHGNS